jgi:hypothetical protein
MKMGVEFWTQHVAAARLQATSASDYAKQHGIWGRFVFHDRSGDLDSSTGVGVAIGDR